MLFVALATVRMSDFFASFHMLVLQIYCQRNVLSELFGNLFACLPTCLLTACLHKRVLVIYSFWQQVG